MLTAGLILFIPKILVNRVKKIGEPEKYLSVLAGPVIEVVLIG